MKTLFAYFSVTLLAIAGFSQVAQAAQVGESAPDFALPSASGETHKLSDYKGKYVVLEWVNFGCPFVRKFYDAGKMQALQEHYTEKGVVWLMVCSSAEGKQGYMDAEAAKKAISEEGVKATALLLDPEGTVGMQYAAKTTPHMYVINPEGVLIYAGAIDSKPSTSSADIEGATNYVEAALEAAMAGEAVEVEETKAYGCSVKYAR